MICPKCGNDIGDNMKFCPNCGSPVSISTPVSTTSAPQKKIKKRLLIGVITAVLVVALAIFGAITFLTKPAGTVVTMSNYTITVPAEYEVNTNAFLLHDRELEFWTKERTSNQIYVSTINISFDKLENHDLDKDDMLENVIFFHEESNDKKVGNLKKGNFKGVCYIEEWGGMPAYVVAHLYSDVDSCIITVRGDNDKLTEKDLVKIMKQIKIEN